jgi:hypothetical protein
VGPAAGSGAGSQCSHPSGAPACLHHWNQNQGSNFYTVNVWVADISTKIREKLLLKMANCRIFIQNVDEKKLFDIFHTDL